MHPDGPVVIALDGSPHSTGTLRWGMDEATLRNAPVLLVRVYRMPRKFAQWSWYPLIDEDLGFDPEATAYLADQNAHATQRWQSTRTVRTDRRCPSCAGSANRPSSWCSEPPAARVAHASAP